MNSADDKNVLFFMRRRVLICAAFMVIPLALLVLRLWQVQVLQGAELMRKSQRQSLRPVRVAPVRGRIFSSDGTELVGNANVYDAVFYLMEMRQPGRPIHTMDYVLEQSQRLARLIGRKPTLTSAQLRTHMITRPAMPLVVFSNLTEEERSRLWEITPWLTGLDIQPRFVRKYYYPTLLSHVLGFTGTNHPSEDFLGRLFARSYVNPEQGGRGGLELMYDQELTGTAGAKMVLVDPLGYAREELPGSIPAQNGLDLILTIDLKAQMIGEKLMEGHKGALVLMEVKTGKVLAMVSKPGFDLSTLTGKEYARLNGDQENKPMLNRAVNALYAPGSIIKPLVAIAALENDAIADNWQYECQGAYVIGKTRIHCAKRYGHGLLDVYEAITVSCNPFFMTTGIRTGIETLEKYFSAAGLGRKTGIDTDEYVRGLCPSRQAARDRYKRNWLMVDTAYASMGQGLIQVTPLQMACYCCALANGGVVPKPYLVSEIRRSDTGALVRRTVPQVGSTIPVRSETLEIIQAAMSNVVESPQGSGHLLTKLMVKDPQGGDEKRVFLAAKTGTAEMGIGEDKTKDTWMISFGPLPEARYALVCMVEKGDSGGKTVAPIVLAFWKEWLNTKVDKDGQD